MLNGKFDELNDRVSSDSPCREYFREISMNERFYLFELKLNYFVCLFIYGYGVFGFKHVRGEMVQNEERERRAVKACCYALD